MKLRALDLFCCAGGASRGLADAGFDVVGIDLVDQPRYPYEFIRADALVGRNTFIAGFDFVWASPPCQHSTAYARTGRVAPVANLIGPTRRMLEAARVPYVIENVTGARTHLRAPIMLCGSMFGLDVRRHRLFECTFPVAELSCAHRHDPRFGQASNRANKRSTVEVGSGKNSLAVQSKAMGIDWMRREELSQAIPPAFSRYLAEQFLKGA